MVNRALSSPRCDHVARFRVPVPHHMGTATLGARCRVRVLTEKRDAGRRTVSVSTIQNLERFQWPPNAVGGPLISFGIGSLGGPVVRCGAGSTQLDNASRYSTSLYRGIIATTKRLEG